MRRHLARHARAVLLAFANRAQRRCRAHVADVHGAARHLGQRDVALHHDRLGHARDAAQAERRGVIALVRHAFALQRGILAMLEHGHVEHAGIFERSAHQQRRLHRPAVVGNPDASGRAQLRDVGQLLAVRSLRHGADRIDAREVRLRRLLQDVLGDARVVVDRRRVRHAGHGGESAGHRRRRAGRDRFLVLLTGLAQMHVHVEQTRVRTNPAGTSIDLRAVDRNVLSHARDAIAVDQHVEDPVTPVRGIDDPPALKQPLHVPLRPPVDTRPPSGPRRRWRPARESPSTARPPLRTRSPRRDSSGRDA